MTDQAKAEEIIRSLISVIEGTEEEYGLIDMLDGYYYGSSAIVDIENLVKEAKLFLMENR